MDKGSRIRIVKGKKGEGVAGTIFWVGENKYGDGKRFGVEGDDGETYWVPSENCEIADAAASSEPEPDLSKGQRVRWRRGEKTGTGAIFWLGPSKHGPGSRVGVRDDETEEAIWIASRLVTVLSAEDDAGPPVRAMPKPVVQFGGDDEPPLSESEFASASEPPPFAPPPDVAEVFEESDEEVPY